jgi:hypothetical protein
MNSYYGLTLKTLMTSVRRKKRYLKGIDMRNLMGTFFLVILAASLIVQPSMAATVQPELANTDRLSKAQLDDLEASEASKLRPHSGHSSTNNGIYPGTHGQNGHSSSNGHSSTNNGYNTGSSNNGHSSNNNGIYPGTHGQNNGYNNGYNNGSTNNNGTYPGTHGQNNGSSGHSSNNNGYNNGYNTGSGNNNGSYHGTYNGHSSNNNGTNGFTNDDIYFYRSIGITLDSSLSYLRGYNNQAAFNGIRQVSAALANRFSSFDIRLRQIALTIENDIRRNQIRNAIANLQNMIVQVRSAANSSVNNGLSHQERRNRRQWMSDISGIISNLNVNRIRIARMGVQKLSSDIRTFGTPSSFNRDLMRQVQFVGMSLNDSYTDVRRVIRELSNISRNIQQSLR